MIADMKRSSGVLLHVTSLPSPFGIGDLGPQSRQFADMLSNLKQRYWSILPVNPTRLEYGNSPYKNYSTFAGNTLLISPEQLAKEDLLSKDYIQHMGTKPSSIVDYQEVEVVKKAMLKKAYCNFKKRGNPTLGARDFESFCSEETEWLEDYVLYQALREQSGEPWYLWPEPLRNREPSAIANKDEKLRELIQEQKFGQYVFFSQWFALKDYCVKKNVKIIGDMPFYVGYDSVDMWAHPELFKLTKKRRPRFVGGVPPDYFSSTGQLWGDPVYDWKQLRKTCFSWWINRISHNLRFCDALRFDHFRGFVAYWQVPASEKIAKAGRWIRAPARTFFAVVQDAFPALPFIAEDLGSITQNVKEAIARLRLPGMKVLLFAFNGSQANPHLPQNYVENTVAYTGTHDTNTVKGWFIQEAAASNKKQLSDYIGRQITKYNVNIELIKLALASKSNLSIIPMQDALGLGAEARMNHPAKQTGNWQWRITTEQLANINLKELGKLTKQFNR